MNKYLRSILVFSVCICIFGLGVNVFAKEAVGLSDDESVVVGNLDARLRSTSLPTTGLDLSKQSYKANVIRAVKGWLYTDVYFKVGSNRRIYISYSFTSNNGENARIGVYDMTDGYWVQEKVGLSGNMIVSDLNTSHKYVVAFAGYQTGFGSTIVQGTAIITN